MVIGKEGPTRRREYKDQRAGRGCRGLARALGTRERGRESQARAWRDRRATRCKGQLLGASCGTAVLPDAPPGCEQAGFQSSGFSLFLSLQARSRAGLRGIRAGRERGWLGGRRRRGPSMLGEDASSDPGRRLSGPWRASGGPWLLSAWQEAFSLKDGAEGGGRTRRLWSASWSAKKSSRRSSTPAAGFSLVFKFMRYP